MSPISRRNVSSERRFLRLCIAAAGLAGVLFVGRVASSPPRGLQAEYFASDRPGGTPLLAGVDSTVSTDRVLRRWYGAPPDVFTAQWFGYLTTPGGGRYTFALTSDDAAVLSIDGTRLIDNG